MNKNIEIFYGSTTGNTEDFTYYLKELLDKSSSNTSIHNVANIKESYSFLGKNNIKILASSTWGIEPATLQEDFELFWSNLDKSSIHQRKFIIIGLGDSYYPHFAFATDILEQDIKANGGILLNPSLKLQDPWEHHIDEIENLANSMV